MSVIPYYRFNCGCLIGADGITISSCLRHKIVPRMEKSMNNSQIKRYYIAADSIAEPLSRGENAPNCFMNLSEAIEKATSKIQEGNHKTVAIVQIIRIVRRATPPVIVENVK